MFLDKLASAVQLLGYFTDKTENVASQSCNADANDVAGGLTRHRLSKYMLQVYLFENV